METRIKLKTNRIGIDKVSQTFIKIGTVLNYLINYEDRSSPYYHLRFSDVLDRG